MFCERHTVDITVNSSGDGTGYTPLIVGARVLDIQYVPDGSTPYDNTVDVTITGETTGKAILTKSNVAAAFTATPRGATHDVTGAASLYAAGGAAVNDQIPIALERIKILLAQGGNAKTGRFYVTVG
jgi:hypothetical protein